MGNSDADFVDYRVKARMVVETHGTDYTPTYYVELQGPGYAEGMTVAHYHGKGSRQLARRHTRVLKAALLALKAPQ